jgi:hypothetical protein
MRGRYYRKSVIIAETVMHIVRYLCQQARRRPLARARTDASSHARTDWRSRAPAIGVRPTQVDELLRPTKEGLEQLLGSAKKGAFRQARPRPAD